tara:strand:- start:154 stop:621 length:468 start_codon:yes stop_codon:yes gene_type:complete
MQKNIEMNSSEVNLFKDAISYAQKQYYLDAVNTFKKFIKLYSKSELVDDAYYNIGLCYFQMSLFNKAIEIYNIVIKEYKDSVINCFDQSEEGKTAAKCHYSILNCYLALNMLENAELEMEKIKKYKDSYVLIKGEKKTFYELALTAIKNYKSINN